MKLSIIIVNYNVTELLRKCLLSIENRVKNVAFEVLVIDNNSPDSSWQSLKTEFPTFRFIASEKNEGFAIANNKAIKSAKGEYVLLLNPDTEIENDAMKEILDFADRQQSFGCLGVRMHDANGEFLPESKRSIPDVFNSFEKLYTNFRKNTSKSYYRNDIDEYEIAPVEVITGAFLLMKKSLYEEVGGLDEKYFMYGEDIDLCFTLVKKNYVNWYYGKASILHYKGESTIKDAKYVERFYNAMQIFVDKYYKTQKPLQYRILSAGLKLRKTLEKSKIKRDTN